MHFVSKNLTDFSMVNSNAECCPEENLVANKIMHFMVPEQHLYLRFFFTDYIISIYGIILLVVTFQGFFTAC